MIADQSSVEAKRAEPSDRSLPNPQKESQENTPSRIDRSIENLRSTAWKIVDESARQYGQSVNESIAALSTFHVEGKSLWKRIKEFLLMPVWVPGRKQTVKEHTRAGLFILDVVRFGGTFAGIFLVLFSAMNYESLWHIVTPKVAALLSPPSVGESIQAEEATETRHDKSPLLVRSQRRRRLNFLPDVGPPDNFLIIPKLSLHVPLVEPPTQNLLKQNWKEVEEDIQHALLGGVILYPGTARPGQAGNVFITGHSSYYAFVRSRFKSVFARLSELEPGDEYWITFGGDRHRYRVQSKREVSPNDITVLDQPLDQRIGTLMTCTPVGTTLRRLVVLAQEIDPSTGIAMNVGEKAERTAQRPQVEALPI
jgi:LPXTG-site transpeptidase (sortase) family protein